MPTFGKKSVKRMKRNAKKRKPSYLSGLASRAGNMIKDRYISNGYPRYMNIINDLVTLKELINIEKKRYDVAANAALVGQVNANATGTFVVDATPVPTQGVSYQQRTGSSIKIVSAYHEYTFINQTNNNHKTEVQIEYWMIKGAPQTGSTFLSDIYNVNPGTNLIDLMSDIDPDYRGQAKCFMKKRFTVPAPHYSGQLVQKVVKVPMKLQHHVRFNDDTATVTDGQIIVIIRADSGNYGLVSTVNNMLTQQTLSGLTFNYDLKYYYVDN